MGVKVMGIVKDKMFLLRHICPECNAIITDRFFHFDEKVIYEKCESCRGIMPEKTVLLIRKKITEEV